MLEAVGAGFPETKYLLLYRLLLLNVFFVKPRSKVKLVINTLKAIHAQENKKAAREKAWVVVEKLHSTKLKEVAKKGENGIEETLSYCEFPAEHWTPIRANNWLDRRKREICHWNLVVGSFPDGNTALMLGCTCLRHIVAT